MAGVGDDDFAGDDSALHRVRRNAFGAGDRLDSVHGERSRDRSDINPGDLEFGLDEPGLRDVELLAKSSKWRGGVAESASV